MAAVFGWMDPVTGFIRFLGESTGTCHKRQLYTVTGSLHRFLTVFRQGSCQILHVSSRFSREMHRNTAAGKHWPGHIKSYRIFIGLESVRLSDKISWALEIIQMFHRVQRLEIILWYIWFYVDLETAFCCIQFCFLFSWYALLCWYWKSTKFHWALVPVSRPSVFWNLFLCCMYNADSICGNTHIDQCMSIKSF